MNVLYLLLGAGLVAATTAAGAETPSPPTPAAMVSTRIVIPGFKINGQPAQAELDTGSSITSLSSGAANRLLIQAAPGLRPAIVLDDNTTLTLSEPTEITVNGESLAAQIAINRSPLKETDANDCIIGWQEIRNNILVFDASTRTINCVDELPPEVSGWQKLKIHPANILLLELPLPDGTTGEILVDTGNPYGAVLPVTAWKEWRTAHPSAATGTYGYYESGGRSLIHNEIAWADDVNLGPLALTAVPVSEVDTLAANITQNYAGTLGLEALARMDFIVDGKAGYAYLRPKPAPTQTNDPATNLKSALTDNSNWKIAGHLRLRVESLLMVAGIVKTQQDDYQGAITDLTNALNLDPKIAKCWTYLGICKCSQGNIIDGLTDLNRAIELDPTDVLAYTNRGSAKASQGDLDGALADLKRAVELNPNKIEAVILLSKVELAKGDAQNGLATLEHGAELNPKNADLLSRIGELKANQGDVKGALDAYAQVVALNPQNIAAYAAHGSLELKQNDAPDAIVDFSRVIELDPKNADAYGNRALAKLRQKDYDGVITDMNHAADLSPNTALIYAVRGTAKRNRGEVEASIADLTHALELDSGNARFYQERAKAWQWAGNYANSLTDYQKYVAMNPSDLLAVLHCETLQLLLGNAPANFKDTVAGWTNTWAKLLGNYLTGAVDESTLLTVIGTASPAQQPSYHCLADYYIGMKRLSKGDQAGARDFFTQCVATGVKDMGEYDDASAELRLLDAAAKK